MRTNELDSFVGTSVQGSIVNVENPMPNAANTRLGGASPAAVGRTANHRQRHDNQLDLWRLAHRALRGRYRLALVLAAMGMLTGAGIGAAMGKRLYRATGLVRIASARPAIMKETDQNQMMPMFDGYIQAQQEVMTSRQTVQAAIRNEHWGAVRLGGRSVSEEQFAASLKVETRHRSDHLRVTYTDRDPRVAAAAVRSVIAAYQRAYDDEQKRVEQQRIGELDRRRNALHRELEVIETEVGPLGTALHGVGPSAAIDPLYDAAASRLKKLRVSLADVQHAMAGGLDTAESAAGQARTSASSLEPSPGESIATHLLAAQTAEQTRNEMELNRLTQYGYGSAHPIIVRLTKAVREGQERVAQYAWSVEDWRRAPMESVVPDSDELTRAERLKEQEAALVRLAAVAEEDVKQLAARRARLAMLGQRANELRQGFSEVGARFDALTTEAALGSRLTIVSGGDEPMIALLDNRHKAAAVGAALGGGAPIGILVLLATARRRYRNAAEVAEDLGARVPFVAVLPKVDDGATCAAAAAQAVHHLRVRLQPPTASACRTYLITSPAAGDGKSGIALALGLSFAAAGYRTLLIDGDLSGRRLTRAFGADDAATRLSSSKSGALDAADGGELTISAVRAGLSFMSAGRGRPQDVYTLAPVHVARLLHRVRERFDVVLIDSDPLLTGVATGIVAPQVDGVVLTVTRDQSHGSVREAMRLLEQQGAQIAGCVFNRAAARRSSPKSARRSSPKWARLSSPTSDTDVRGGRIKFSQRQPPDLRTDMSPASGCGPLADAGVADQAPAQPGTTLGTGRALPPRLHRFGPLVAAVMSSLALSRDEDLDLMPLASIQARPDTVLQSRVA